MSYTCPKCGRISHHPRDEVERYCNYCHQFEEFEPVAMSIKFIVEEPDPAGILRASIGGTEEIGYYCVSRGNREKILKMLRWVTEALAAQLGLDSSEEQRTQSLDAERVPQARKTDLNLGNRNL